MLHLFFVVKANCACETLLLFSFGVRSFSVEFLCLHARVGTNNFPSPYSIQAEYTVSHVFVSRKRDLFILAKVSATMKVRVYAARKQPVEIDGLSDSDTWDTVRNRAKMALQSNSTHSILLLHGEQVSSKLFQLFGKLSGFEFASASVLLSKRSHFELFYHRTGQG
jgi:hypothetical protein